MPLPPGVSERDFERALDELRRAVGRIDELPQMFGSLRDRERR